MDISTLLVFTAQLPLSYVVATDSSHRRSPSLAEAVSAKIEDGNIKAAIRIISSDEQLVLPSVDTLAALQAKHPAARQDSVHIPDPQPDCQLVMDENVVLRGSMALFRQALFRQALFRHHWWDGEGVR
jgi:hypothetical protein